MLTDPIANFLNRLRNASYAQKKELAIRSSRVIKSIADLLLKKNVVEKVEENIIGKTPELIITLKSDRGPINMKRISKPGQRIYVSYTEIKPVRSGFGIGIFSTSAGILTDREAREKKIGGEYICELY